MNFEPLQLFWQNALPYVPLGIIGAWRWSVWLWQNMIRFFYRPIPSTPAAASLSLSIVTPVYNEDPSLFQRALTSWALNRPSEIIAVIDATDRPCISIFERFAREYPERHCRLIITDVPGKRPALARGAQATTGAIIALVDSDTVWDYGIAEKLLAPFRDQAVGGVATRQAVLRPNTLAKKLFSMRLNLRYFHEFPYLSVVGHALTCLSGRTAVYRREALLPVLDAMVNETFLTRPCISGEDKRLTSLILGRGWQVRYQQNAVVRTVGMPRLGEFFRQNLRWGRNSWRTDLRLLSQGWVWTREPLFAYHLIDRAIQPFTLLLGPIYLGVALSLQHWWIAGILVSWWMISRTIKLFPHLREYPSDIVLVPAFIASQYILAVIKIYALFTLDYQSWITRWHALRIKYLSFFELLPSRLATLSVIGGMAFAITSHAYAVEERAAARRAAVLAAQAIPYTEDFSGFGLDQQKEEFERLRREHAFDTYITRAGDTPLLLEHKWQLPPETLQALFPNVLPTTPLAPGRRLEIPVESLRVPLNPARITTRGPPQITYDLPSHTITVKGRGSVVTLPQVAESLRLQGRTALLTASTPGEWLLTANLYISEGVTFIIDGNEVAWLKLESTPERFIRLRAYNATVLIRGTKITSWDTVALAPDRDPGDGRAYVLAQANGRMDVIDSEIAYLGYSRAVAIAQEDRVGGVYGLSWKIPNDTIGRFLLTGRVTGNRIHDNYFGLYTFGVSSLVIQNNEFYENVQYGIDPHDDSSNLFIAENYVHNNGNHGIIVSKRVVYSTIRDNRSVNNRLHGIMLDRESNYNLVENNLALGNVNGLALYESHHNLVRGNTFTLNRFGIRANMQSSQNRFEGNSIRNNERGVYLYGGANNNVIVSNTFSSNIQALNLKETTGNIVQNPISSSANVRTIKTDEIARTGNFIQPFE